MGPASTSLGVQFEVRSKPRYWQSGQVSMSLHTGCHVESALHCIEGGDPIEQVTSAHDGGRKGSHHVFAAGVAARCRTITNSC